MPIYGIHYQVNNYGMGGQYEPHYDMKTLHDIKKQSQHRMGEAGNRVATLLVYLGEPLGGGATVFTESGARLSPVKVRYISRGDRSLLRAAGLAVRMRASNLRRVV